MRQRKTLRDIKTQNQKALDTLAAMCGKEQTFKIDIKPKRVIVNHSDKQELEAAVMNEVSALIAHHPNVLFAVRQNSGMSYSDSGAPVWFYRWAKSQAKMRISDYWGMLRDGRMFAIECKRRNWKAPSGDREMEQLTFILQVKYAGGSAGFVRGIDEAKAILDCKNV